MSLSEITSLQQTLNTAIDTYKAELAAQGLPEPSLRTSRPHAVDEITYLPSPAMFEARRAAVASMGLLKQLIISPYEYMAAWSFTTPATIAGLRLVAQIGVSDVLAEAPVSDLGLTVAEIAAKTDVDALKLERVMRLLMIQGFYREPKEGYFANNRLSNLIKQGTPGYHLHTYMNRLMTRVAEKLPDAVAHPDPEFRHATDPYHTAWNLAYDTDLPYFGADGWLTKDPEEAQSFGIAIGAVGTTSDPGVAADFPWVAATEGKDAIVDVGGGQGTLCCSLAIKHPEIKSFIVQDIAETQPTAESYIVSKDLATRVTSEAQDFFKPQRRKGNYLFVLQRVLHDWSTEQGAQILGHLRDVLHPESSILIVDTLIDSAVMSPSGSALQESISQLGQFGQYQRVPPPPFIPVDFGEASLIPHGVNTCLTALCNSFERTVPQLQEMVELAGLKIKKIYPTRGWASITEVVPD